jgi:hypothetical protein
MLEMRVPKYLLDVVVCAAVRVVVVRGKLE